MALLIPIAFAAGLITVLTPCILPVLPIILAGGSSSGSLRRPYAIVGGLVTTFTVFTLAGAWIFSELGIPSKYQIRIGAGMLLLVALTLVVPKVGEVLERPFLFLTRRRAADLGGGFVLGASLGLVFVPCAGPVLGAVSANVGSHRVGLVTAVIALAYALGAAVPMLLIAQGSRRTATLFRAHGRALRVGAGVLMAAAAIVVYNGWATGLQTSVPGYAATLQNWIEGNHTAKAQLADLQGRRRNARLPDVGSAPDFRGISRWVNTKPLSLASLRGHVVLVDFWTYSCINCLRTLPHLEAWDKRYRSRGLVIVGVHTPEFAFEHDYGNVREAVHRLDIRYPVALDNNYSTWNAYQNNYWPAEYLIDQRGIVRHVNFGEGDYGKTEHAIRALLGTGGATASVPDLTPRTALTPETYLGYFRLQRYAGSKIAADAQANYVFPRSLPLDDIAYAGSWKVESERIVSGDGARLRLHFDAHDVYIVLGGRGHVRTTLDGRPSRGFAVNADKLYTVVSDTKLREGTLELAFTPGVNAYSFTFG